MRCLSIALACLAMTGCSKAPDGNSPGETTTNASGVAFAYRYAFRLPSNRIADAQEAQAEACERLAPGQCRITGMTYRLDDSGQVVASLDVRVAATVARAFGRRGVQGVERAGGALTGAEITGTDAAPAIATAQEGTADAQTDMAEIDRQLARSDLSTRLRSELTARRAELVARRRESAVAMIDAQASVATTPIRFDYAAGAGVGLTARLGEAAQAGFWSLTWTLISVLTVVAYLGPPLLLLVLLGVFWDRMGRRWWGRVFPGGRAE
ncbi:hypothetical protein [Sphingomonas mollis]|uniref:DUF4349 domain-containing protein n=1 Tax=Sphingomonas mollis TaxID=2795726 RepID=A0ABS0XL93_9SPHN|nr:hypothetical protein [Sphingomonas sp. BT553]MBJ6120808.1 hypothetical protein [Sphingomonas sp. BT553]